MEFDQLYDFLSTIKSLIVAMLIDEGTIFVKLCSLKHGFNFSTSAKNDASLTEVSILFDSKLRSYILGESIDRFKPVPLAINRLT